MRLQLENGDAQRTWGPNPGSIALGETTVVPMSFVIPADTTSFTLVDHQSTVIASWTDIALPEL